MKNLPFLNVGESATVIEVEKSSSVYQRLLDIGLIPGTRVKCVLKSITGNPKAYLIRGSVIAIRNGDAEKIIIN